LNSIAFASREGKKIFKSSLEKDGLKSFYNLIEQHHTQTEPAFCGVSTRKYGIVMLMMMLMLMLMLIISCTMHVVVNAEYSIQSNN
jgi:hypothetical protein